MFKELAKEMTNDVHSVVDLRHMVVSNLVRDKDVLNRLVKEILTPAHMLGPCSPDRSPTS